MSGSLTAIIIVLILAGGLTATIVSWFILQAHRADAVAMAGYRQLAEQAVANQDQLAERLAAIEARIGSVEQILRDVG